MLKLSVPHKPTKGGEKAMPIPSVFYRIIFPLGSWLILRRASLACPIMDTKEVAQRLDASIERHEEKTLSLVQIADGFLPLSSRIIYQMMNEAGRDIVKPTDLIEFYSGNTHIESIKTKISGNEAAQIDMTGELYMDRLRELGINLNSDFRKICFAITDLACRAKAVNIRSGKDGCNRFDAQVGKFVMKNCVVPPDLTTPKEGDTVIVHFGAMIDVDSEDYDSIFEAQSENETVTEWLSKLTNISIDFREFCGRFNLTRWVEEQL